MCIEGSFYCTCIFEQFQDSKTSTQLTTDYKGSSYTASATAAQVDPLNGSGMYRLKIVLNRNVIKQEFWVF